MKNWSLMRFLQAGMAVWAFSELYNTGQWLMLVPGILFATQAIFNVGCCGAAGCAAPPSRNAGGKTTEEVAYEEIK
jgi:hypothetical protein